MRSNLKQLASCHAACINNYMYIGWRTFVILSTGTNLLFSIFRALWYNNAVNSIVCVGIISVVMSHGVRLVRRRRRRRRRWQARSVKARQKRNLRVIWPGFQRAVERSAITLKSHIQYAPCKSPQILRNRIFQPSVGMLAWSLHRGLRGVIHPRCSRFAKIIKAKHCAEFECSSCTRNIRLKVLGE